MDLSVSYGFSDQLSALRQARLQRAPVPPVQAKSYEGGSRLPVPVPVRNDAKGATTSLLSRQEEELPDGGYRLTSTFQKDDGRTFTKVEELALTERGARKTVIQQNPSGSFTRYEEVLDREDSGNFRRTQRFQDGNGDVATTITPDYKVTDAFVLTGGQSAANFLPYSPFTASRGTQLDLRA